jgi:hypothetical protein
LWRLRNWWCPMRSGILITLVMRKPRTYDIQYPAC